MTCKCGASISINATICRKCYYEKKALEKQVNNVKTFCACGKEKLPISVLCKDCYQSRGSSSSDPLLCEKCKKPVSNRKHTAPRLCRPCWRASKNPLGRRTDLCKCGGVKQIVSSVCATCYHLSKFNPFSLCKCGSKKTPCAKLCRSCYLDSDKLLTKKVNRYFNKRKHL